MILPDHPSGAAWRRAAPLSLKAAEMPLLSLSHIAKAYGGAIALRSASLELPAGEVHALMGENGAGKSTLIKILAGAVAPDAGEIRIDGERVEIAGPDEATALGLRFIHQELNIVPQLSVAENLFLGRAAPRRLGAFVDWPALYKRAAGALAALGIDGIDPRLPAARLSTGDRMLVKIASAFFDDGGAPARIYVLDEPTAALSGAECDRLFAIIETLKAKGCGILFVSHRMDEVMRICDRVTVLRDGESRATLEMAQTSRAEIIELMTGRAVIEDHSARTAAGTGEPVLVLKNVGNDFLKDISFELRPGEVLGLAGLEGSGQGRLLKLLTGGPHRGEIRLSGRNANFREPADAWEAGIACVPRERRAEGLVLSQPIVENATLPHLARFRRLAAFLDRKRELAAMEGLAGRVRLKAAGLRQRMWQLSGGNQQKVVLARAMMGSPALLLLDEPTRGVDVGAKYDIHGLLRELSAKGTAILLASSDFPELIALSHRIAVMRGGRIAAIVPAEGMSPQQLLALCYGEPAHSGVAA
jgi:ABC-type sugar transport system ATPase subunit